MFRYNNYLAISGLILLSYVLFFFLNSIKATLSAYKTDMRADAALQAYFSDI